MPLAFSSSQVAPPDRASSLIPYRRDIDGLRGVAVTLVVAFHAFPNIVPGGFLGVDVFFVISGYLITSVILADAKADRFSFWLFYGRRIRRIFPSLIVVLAALLAAGWFVLLADEYASVGRHVVAGSGFASNLLLWREVGYFDVAAETKPLLHLWSIGVEEQFYLVWPFLVWTSTRRRISVRTLCFMVGGLSLAGALLLAPHHQSAAFYSPFTRFWELMAGALLAETSTSSRTRSRVPRAAGLIGVLLVMVALLLVRTGDVFPVGWLIVAVAGAVLIIAAGPNGVGNQSVLSSRALVMVGLISYPLYLWHWPLLSLARIVQSETPAIGLRIGAVALAVALSTATYWLVERPVRVRPVSKTLCASLAGALLAVFVCGGAVVWKGGVPSRITGNAHLNLELNEPRFSGVPCRTRFEHFDDDHCAETGGGPKTVLLLGDSHVRHSFFLVRDYLAQEGYKVIALSKGGCPFLLGVTATNVPDCEAANQEALAFLKSRHDVTHVFLAAEYTSYTDGGTLAPASSSGFSNPGLLEQALASTLDTLRAWHPIFMYQIPPLTFDPRRCVPRPFRLTRVASGCSDDRIDVDRKVGPYLLAVNSVLRRSSDIQTFDVTDVLCGRAVCSASNYGDVLYFNETHLNAIGADFVKTRASFPRLD